MLTMGAIGLVTERGRAHTGLKWRLNHPGARIVVQSRGHEPNPFSVLDLDFSVRV
jgi:hypothetical protein